MCYCLFNFFFGFDFVVARESMRYTTFSKRCEKPADAFTFPHKIISTARAPRNQSLLNRLSFSIGCPVRQTHRTHTHTHIIIGKLTTIGESEGIATAKRNRAARTVNGHAIARIDPVRGNETSATRSARNASRTCSVKAKSKSRRNRSMVSTHV